jgi:hypothetical protein
VVVINVLLGWTFIGWVVALAMAARSKSSVAVVNVSANATQPAWPPPNRNAGTGFSVPLVASDSVAAPQLSYEPTVCPNGHAVTSDAKFCPQCGVPLSR